MEYIGTGLHGLVGSRLVELLRDRHSFVSLGLEEGIDITNESLVTEKIVSNSAAQWVLHLAAYTDVQGAEKDRNLGENSQAWKVNVEATQYIINACKRSGKRLLYIDTDYAFDGVQPLYTELDIPRPLGWYAKTKTEAAMRVFALGDMGLVVRISNPYRAHPQGKKDFVHKILERLEEGKLVVAPSDQIFVPTFVDDIALAIERLTEDYAMGIYHVVGSTSLSPYEAAKVIALVYGCDVGLISPTSFASYFAGKAAVPQFAALTNEKLKARGISMHEFKDGLEEIKRQEA